ncbi:hypothetical protein V6N11_024119 [Hibiscus sabdariffa]|uniref:Uncharacterized protein n=1 Tax=Hibiscus sabdariffa TaxID=183260 RepID=A0ABR1ZV43_9ROSI
MNWLVSITRRSVEIKRECEKFYDRNCLCTFVVASIGIGATLYLALLSLELLVREYHKRFRILVLFAITVIFILLHMVVFWAVLQVGLRSLVYVFNHTRFNELNTSVDPGFSGTREIRLSVWLTAPACVVCWVSVPLSGWLLYYVLQKMVILSFHVHVLRFLEPRIMVCSVVFFITFVSAVFFSLCNLQEIGEKYFESVQPRSTDVESSTSNVVVQAPAPELSN